MDEGAKEEVEKYSKAEKLASHCTVPSFLNPSKESRFYIYELCQIRIDIRNVNFACITCKMEPSFAARITKRPVHLDASMTENMIACHNPYEVHRISSVISFFRTFVP